MKAVARVVGLVLGVLALAAGLHLVLLTIWLRSAPGHAWIARTLAREAREQLGLTLSVGRVGGNMVGGIRLEQIVLRDAQRRLVARADVLSARYQLHRLVRLHEVDELVLARPVIARLPTRVARAAPPPGKPTTFSVRNLRIIDGSWRSSDHTLQDLSAKVAMTPGPGLHGQRFESEAELIVDHQPLLVRVSAALDGGRTQVAAVLQGARFRARGDGAWSDGRVTARLESLDVDASVGEATRRWAGRGPLHASGALAGPLDGLELKLHGHTANRGLALGALVDVPRRTARLTAAVAAPTRSARLQARGTWGGGVLDVTALEARTGATWLLGSGRADGGALEATLAARVAPAEAAVIGIRPTAPIRLRAALAGPPRALEVRLHGRLRAARVALGGRIDVSSGRGRVRFEARDVSVSQIVRDAPPLVFSGAFRFEGALGAREGVVGHLSVRDGSLRVAGLRFDRLLGAGQVRLARSGQARVEALSGQLEGRRLRRGATQAVIRWDRKAVHCDVAQAILDGTRASGEVVYTLDRVTHQPLVVINARTLSLSPSLVQEALYRRPPRAWPGHAKLVWMGRELGLAFALDTDQGRASGKARLRRRGGALDLTGVDVAVGGSRLRGAARVQNGQLVASLDELLIQPRLLRSLWPSTLDPARPIRVEGSVAGPLHALDLHLLATAGASTARLRGQIDWPERRFRLLAVLDNLYLQSIQQTRKSRIDLEMAAIGRLVDGGVAGTLQVRHAWGQIEGLPLEAGRLDAKLDGPRFQVEQLLLGVPGAVLEGKGGGSFRDFHIGYGVVITDALQLRKVPKPIRVMVGVTALTPGRSVVGALQRHAGGDVRMTHHAVPPPFRVVNLLYHLIIGHPLHLTVQ